MRAILLDTNAYAAFKQGQPEAVEIVRRATRLLINAVVLGELLAGFAAGTREAKNRAELQQFLASPRVTLVGIDDHTADYYAAVYKALRGKGRPIPTNDMWIAATALQHGAALFSVDAHFDQIDGVVVGSTLVDLMRT